MLADPAKDSGSWERRVYLPTEPRSAAISNPDLRMRQKSLHEQFRFYNANIPGIIGYIWRSGQLQAWGSEVMCSSPSAEQPSSCPPAIHIEGVAHADGTAVTSHLRSPAAWRKRRRLQLRRRNTSAASDFQSRPFVHAGVCNCPVYTPQSYIYAAPLLSWRRG